MTLFNSVGLLNHFFSALSDPFSFYTNMMYSSVLNLCSQALDGMEIYAGESEPSQRALRRVKKMFDDKKLQHGEEILI